MGLDAKVREPYRDNRTVRQQRGLFDPLTIHIGAIRAALVGHHVHILHALDDGVFTRHLPVIELDVT